MNASVKTPSSVAKRLPPRMIEVLRIERPHLEIKRVVFSGDGLKGFPANMNGAHIKLFFPREHQIEPQLPTLGASGPIWPSASERPVTRTYSVRYYDALRNELAVDFARHRHRGPAQQWLDQAKQGQRIGLAGPGGPDPLIQPAQHQVFVGDTSALAAIWALTEMPSPSQKSVFLVSNHPVDFDNPLHSCKIFRPLDYPTLTSLYQDLLFDLKQQLGGDAITSHSDLACFVAGENSLVLTVRDYLKTDFKRTKQSLYAVPYWRQGEDEEAYHQARHKIMDEVY